MLVDSMPTITFTSNVGAAILTSLFSRAKEPAGTHSSQTIKTFYSCCVLQKGSVDSILNSNKKWLIGLTILLHRAIFVPCIYC